MKPVAIVIAQSNRKELFKQTYGTLLDTKYVPYKLFSKDGMEKGEMKTVNELIESIDYDWEYLVRSDDDMWFDPYWLADMIDVCDKNTNLAILGGARYPTHKIMEDRGDHYVMDICPGNHWLIKRDVYELLGKFYEDRTGLAEDVRYCRAAQHLGYFVGCMKDPTLVVHCGMTNTAGKGRSDYVKGYMNALGDVTGAKIL